MRRPNKLKFWSIALMALVAALMVPGVTYAHGDIEKEEDGSPVSCDLSLGAAFAGIDVVDVDEGKVEVDNSGAVAIGTQVCSVPHLSGIIVTDHGSEVTLGAISIVPNPGIPGLPDSIAVAGFSGELEGTFTLHDFFTFGVIGTGEVEAYVTGLMVVDPVTGLPILVDGNAIATTETISGAWELEGDNIEGEGDVFTVTLVPGPYTFPDGSHTDLTLQGDGFLSGVLDLDD